MNNGPRSPGKMGVNFSSTRSPHPRPQPFWGHVGENSKLFSTSCVTKEHHIHNENVRLESTSLQPHVRFMEGQILAVSSPAGGHHCKRPMQCRGVAMQIQSLTGQLVSKACFRFSFLESQPDSCAMRTAWKTSFTWGPRWTR